MKILNINSYYYSSTVHKELQMALQNRNIKSMTYVPVYKGYMPRSECNYPDEKWAQKVECFNKTDRFVFHVKHKKILKNIVKKLDLTDYQIIHAHSLFSNGYIAMKIKKQLNVPYVVAVRDTDVNTFFKKIIYLRKLGNEILINADSIIFLSQSYMDEVINKYVIDSYKKSIKKKCYIVPNGINEFWLANKGTSKRLAAKKNWEIVYAGKINKNKNVITTIEAIKVLQKRGMNIGFTVVGWIDSKRVYEQISILPWATYIEPTPKEQLIQIYRACDIFVMPSVHETFGLVYAEAMSQGLPVIYTRGQGFDEQFDEGEVGYHVDCFDPEQIADKIESIVANYENISNNCISSSNKFNWDQISTEYTRIYKGIFHE